MQMIPAVLAFVLHVIVILSADSPIGQCDKLGLTKAILTTFMATREEKANFYREIEKVVLESKGELNWLEAITHYCSKSGMEIEVASTLVNDKLKKKLEEVAVSKNYLKKSARLKNV